MPFGGIGGWEDILVCACSIDGFEGTLFSPQEYSVKKRRWFKDEKSAQDLRLINEAESGSSSTNVAQHYLVA
jgi:hypothetical protein